MHVAYVAGLIDGEGSIRVARQSTGRGFGTEVIIGMNDRRTIEMLHHYYGGYFFEDKTATKPGKRTMYRWGIRGMKAVEFLNMVLPYLIYKKPQAELCIEFGNWWHNLPHPGRGGRKRTDDELKRAQAYYDRCRYLKTI